MLDIRMGDGDTIFLSGRFDASQVETAREAFRPLEHSVVLDLSDLEYISSAGIGFLLATFKRLHDAGKTLTLTNVSPRILNIFRLAGLDRVLVIE